MIYSIDIYAISCQFKTKLGNIFDQFSWRLFALLICFFPYNERTEGIFELR